MAAPLPVREALPRVGNLVPTAHHHGPLAGARPGRCQFRRPGPGRLDGRGRRRLWLDAQSGLRAEEKARAQQHRAGGLAGEEKEPHAGRDCNRDANGPPRPLACSPLRPIRANRTAPMAEFIRELKRTHSCAELTAKDTGKEVVLFGWVHNRRDHGGAVFIDLRDRAGLTQVVFEEDAGKELQELAHELRLEYCIGIRGKVLSRGANVNPKLPTGEVEVHVEDAEIFNRSETPPFLIEDRVDTAEDKRLHYRYLDLRRPVVQRPLLLRSRANAVTRRVLHERGFLEMETPFLVKYTPGGARNFLVPARLQPGRFYALAESPQLFKQLIMVAGFDRYFQIVKCFRDEDLRLDRQPEFTQIDLEMSFVSQDDVFAVVEELVRALWREVL